MLTPEEEQMLALAAEPYRGHGATEREIRRRFGISSVRFYRRLDALVRRADAIAHDPITCRRMRQIAGA